MKGPRTNPNLIKVPLYIAGKSAGEVCEEYGVEDVIKLASNENPLGPSPLAVKAFNQAVTESHRYPGIADRDFRRKLASYHGRGLSEDHFLIANGGTDLLRMIAQGFVFDGGETVMCDLTFPMYRIFTAMFGGKPVTVAPAPDLSIDLDAIAAAITDDTRVVWLCSPNNPTGLLFHHGAIKSFMERIPDHVVVVLDESYLAFVTEPDHMDSLEFILQGHNAISLRSFSKSAGLANMRVGYSIADPEMTEYLLHARLPFNTGSPVMQAAAASLDDHEYLQRSRNLIIGEREFMYQKLVALGVNTLPSQSNFVLLRDLPLSGQSLAEKLMRRGVITRAMDAWGMADAIRVSIGTREQNEHFLNALSEVLATIKVG